MVCGIPKRVIQRYFFAFRVPLTYKDITRLILLCNDSQYDVSQFPKRYTADALIRIKRALEDCRKEEGIQTRASIESEFQQLEVAAEMGNSTAIALLCGARMLRSDATPEDMESGSKLLKQLMDAKFPLAFKISGDLALTLGRPAKSLQFYEMAVEHGLEDNKLLVECLRNIAHLAFKASDLFKARFYFSRACAIAEHPKQVADCHFMLAQLRETDRPAARLHLELSATHGFNDSFLPLGTLLLNWYGEARLAREWFMLALTTDTSGAALVGLLDSYVRLKDFKLAKQTLSKIQSRGDSGKLLKSRGHIVKDLDAYEGSDHKMSPASQVPRRSSRFDF